MTTINLRKFYPRFYTEDVLIEVPDDVAAVLVDAERQEQNYIRNLYRHKAHFSLDAGDGIENEILATAPSPHEMCERSATAEQIHAAIAALPEKQGRRVHAHYILGLSQSAIARTEGVAENAIKDSIRRAIKKLKKYLEKSF